MADRDARAFRIEGYLFASGTHARELLRRCHGKVEKDGVETACSCQGWKNPSSVRPPQPPSQAGDSFNDICNTCKHPLATHGTLRQVEDAELDRRITVVVAIKEQVHLLTHNMQQQNQAQQQQCLARLKLLKDQLLNKPLSGSSSEADKRAREDAVARILSTPPFEKPVIAQFLKNFLEYKYVGRVDATKLLHIQKLAKTFLVACNKQDLIAPPNNEDRVYMVNYQRWLRFCRGMSSSARGPAYSHHLTDVFGRTMLRYILQLVRNSLTSAFLLPPDVSAVLPMFFRDLEQELSNSASVIFHPNFADQVGKVRVAEDARRALERSSAAAAAASSSSSLPSAAPTFPSSAGTAAATGSNGNAADAAAAEAGNGDGNKVEGAAEAGKRSSNDAGAVGGEPSAKRARRTYGPPIGSREQLMMNAYNVKPDKFGQKPPTMPPLPDNLPADGPNVRHSFVVRDLKAKIEERDGIIQLKVITNDTAPQHMVWLIGMKNLFSRQLPRMPREYIARTVLDRNHRCLIVLKRGRVVGGCCFRPQMTGKFAEIVFMAIAAEEQVKGYGTLIMSHLKEYSKSVGLEHFCTYADNYAVGYFRKNGFQKEPTMDREVWGGHIKDYDGGTLMFCKLEKDLNYLNVPQIVELQKKIILKHVHEISDAHVRHTGLPMLGEEDHELIRTIDIPGVRETGYVGRDEAELAEERERLHAVLAELLQGLKEHASSWPFLEPVNPEEVPDYYEIVKTPVDLSLIEQRLRSRKYYITLDIFAADIKRMCDNARMYNSPDTAYYRCAEELEQFAVVQISTNTQLG